MTVGDYWRECSDEELAELLTTFMFSICNILGLDTDRLNREAEIDHLVGYFSNEMDDFSQNLN